MISLRTYLMEPGRAAVRQGEGNAALLAGLCTSVLGSLEAFVFTGEFARFAPQLRELRAAVQPGLGESEATFVDEGVRAALSGYDKLLRESRQNSAMGMEQIAGVLGQALAILAGGSERSVARLRKIQDTLHRTSSSRDIRVLRASLAEAVEFIRDESLKEQQAAAREREGLEAQMLSIREMLAGNPNRGLAGREQGTKAIAEALAALGKGRKLFAVAFVVNQLKGIVQRYGPETVDRLFLELIRERIQPLASAAAVFRWTFASLVGLVESERAAADIRFQVASVSRAPLVQRVATGGRTAVLRVGISHLVLEADSQPAGEVVASLDGFTSFTPAEAC